VDNKGERCVKAIFVISTYNGTVGPGKHYVNYSEFLYYWRPGFRAEDSRDKPVGQQWWTGNHFRIL